MRSSPARDVGDNVGTDPVVMVRMPSSGAHPAGHRWSTADLPVDEQYACWREALRETYTPLLPLGPGSSADRWRSGGLAGVIEERAFRDVRASRIASVRQVHRHGRRELAATDEEVVFVNLQVTGRCAGRQGDRECISRPGMFTVFDATRAFQLEYLDDWAAISFRLPRESLLPLVSDLDRITSVAFDGSAGMGAVVTDLMRALWRVRDDFDGDAQGSESVARVFLPALTSALHGRGGGSSGVGIHDDTSLRVGILEHLRAHLLTADVTPAAVAFRFGVSARKLHQLFETTEWTFSQTVMRLRVEGCARDIAQGDPSHTLTRVAATWGFADLSHMNRVFRATVGRLPSSYRPIRSAG